MLMSSLVLPGLLSGIALAQTTTYFAPGVPRQTAIPGDYDGQYRPRAHFSPPQNFMNDPNGFHRDGDGLWHIYYQLNPVEPVAGNQHWGHATSEDLYHWTNQKIAIWPFNSTTYVYSGSAVNDPNNTSGFFPDQDNGLVALYTIAASGGLQTQNVAYSRDGGYTFETYADNPVINVGSTQFRDPQVTWHAPTEKWVMAVAYSQEFAIEFYTSPNLVNWTAVSNFSHYGLLGLQYECPNMVEMPVEGTSNGTSETMYLLYISINPGAPLGGSVGQYFPGTFNGTHFEAVDSAFRIADFGKDNYATQFFSGVPNNERQVSMAWASNWQYTSVVPTGDTEGWRGQMSLPRYNFLRKLPQLGGWVMVSEPYNIQAVFSEELAFENDLGNSSVLADYLTVPSGALYFEANVTGLTDETLVGTLNFTFTSTISGEYVSGGTFIGTDTWMDRGHADGFENPYFTDKFSATGIYGGQGRWRISGVIDRSIIEIFVNGGEQSMTNTFYTNQPLDTVRIAANGIAEGATVSVGLWALEDTWATQANANGTVLGNTTTSGSSATSGNSTFLFH
ncbi:Invertase [Vermiconidia calcicola]|uniref:Invertase n=1 Tax=Vermiconidia calcicola TaxID=1690605 RepID=A0ACC3NPM3_9PEZI|nr:Invertase [Vermiconidia calcicola]